MSESENEKLVRAFYEATVPGHREALRGIQAPHVIYDMPAGMPFGCGHFEGLQDVSSAFSRASMPLWMRILQRRSSSPAAKTS